MILQLEISSFHKFTSEVDSIFRLESSDSERVTIGRSPSCDWTLPDPERIVSNIHAEVFEFCGSYFVKDTSTNGLFINSSVSALGTGNEATLNHGDSLAIGEYEINVNLFTEEANVSQMNPSAKSIAPDLAGDIESDEMVFRSSQEIVKKPNDLPLNSSEVVNESQLSVDDPMSHVGLYDNAVLPGADASQFIDSSTMQSSSSQRDPQQQNPLTPNPLQNSSQLTASNPVEASENKGSVDHSSKGLSVELLGEEDNQVNHTEVLRADSNLSDDMLLDGANQNQDKEIDVKAHEINTHEVTAEYSKRVEMPYDKNQLNVAIENNLVIDGPTHDEKESRSQSDTSSNAALSSEHQKRQQIIVDARTNEMSDGASNTLVDAFEKGLGVTIPKELVKEPEVFYQNLGSCFALMLSGLIHNQRNRSDFKQRNRLSHTTFTTKKNNPLKFSADIEDAIYNLFLRRSNSFLSPDESIKEAFYDMEVHEQALMNGVHETVAAIMDLLSPDKVESNPEILNKSSGLFASNVYKRYWNEYKETYDELVNDKSNNDFPVYLQDFSISYDGFLKGVK